MSRRPPMVPRMLSTPSRENATRSLALCTSFAVLALAAGLAGPVMAQAAPPAEPATAVPAEAAAPAAAVAAPASAVASRIIVRGNQRIDQLTGRVDAMEQRAAPKRPRN